MLQDPLGHALLIAASEGVMGLFLLALLERLVPLVPSHALYAGVGMAAADGLWCLPAAVSVSVLGSAAGCLPAYAAGRALGRGRMLRQWTRRWRRLRRSLSRLRRHQSVLPVAAQLMPASRLIAPGLSGLAGMSPAVVLRGSITGIALWNSSFIGLGYALAGVSNVTATALVLPLVVIMCFTSAIIFLARRVCRPEPNAGARLQDQ